MGNEKLNPAGPYLITEAEHKRVQEYIAEAWYRKGSAAEQAYAFLWLTFCFLDKAPRWRPNPGCCGLDAATEQRVAEDVEALIIDMRNPMFDRDPVGP